MAQQVQFVYLTQAEYDALGTKDAARLYFTSDTRRMYRGAAPYMPQRTFYGTCSTVATTAIKAVTCGDFTDQDLITGTVLIVKFTYANNTINLQIKVDNGTAKNMKWQDGVDVCSNPWSAGQTVQFVYDGAQWIMMETTLAILKYGSSTWTDFLNAYNRNALVYCQVTVSGGGNRMAFMAYNILSGSNANVEFQYVRSLSTKTSTDQGDETIIYKLDGSGTWTTTTRKNYTRIAAGTGLGGQFSGGTTTPVLTLSNTGVLSINGSTGAVTIPDASTSTKGLVQLNDTIASTSTSYAATANSVKTAYDLAGTKSTVTIVDWED